MINKAIIREIIQNHNENYNEQEPCDTPFSGAVLVSSKEEACVEEGYGFANRSDSIYNTVHTRFAIASGCKLFTAIAICQLVDKGDLDFNTLLSELNIDGLNHFDPHITVHHLLTHTSGIPDYFDEDYMTDFEALWDTVPMYKLTSPRCFLPLFTNKSMKFKPGARFSYSNSGFIILGLIVEALTGLAFNDYVEKNIFKACHMSDSGYFRMDQLPERTAIGYIVEGQNWRTNQYSLPLVGGPDGGAYTTAYDLNTCWTALLKNKLLSKSMTEQLLFPHVQASEYTHYGYGVWLTIINNNVVKYFVMGADPGVAMQSSYYPTLRAQAHILSNTDSDVDRLAAEIDETLLGIEKI